MNTQIFKNYWDFLLRADKKTNGVDIEFANEHPEYEKDNNTNKGCFNCHKCSNCSYCYKGTGLDNVENYDNEKLYKSYESTILAKQKK